PNAVPAPLPVVDPTNTLPEMQTAGRTPIDLDFSDIDGDFDLDILVNHRNGFSRVFYNDGTAHFTEKELGDAGPYPRKKGPYVYNQELCDFDYDGDLDLLLDNAGTRPDGITRGNFTQINVNDGTGRFTDKTRELIFGELGGDDNAVKCADVNG